jgi:tetratricopeptide (TPR) repeat protein
MVEIKGEIGLESIAKLAIGIPACVDGLLSYAEGLIKTFEPEIPPTATNIYDIILERYPDNYRARMGKGNILLQKEQYEEAKQEFEYFKDDAKAKLGVAVCQRNLREHLEAIETLDNLECPEENGRFQKIVLEERIQNLIELESYEEATVAYEQLIEDDPKNEDNYVKLYLMQKRVGDYKDAITTLDVTLDLLDAKEEQNDEIKLAVLYEKANTLEALDEIEHAATVYFDVLALNKDDEEAWKRLTKLALDQDEVDKASEYVTKLKEVKESRTEEPEIEDKAVIIRNKWAAISPLGREDRIRELTEVIDMAEEYLETEEPDNKLMKQTIHLACMELGGLTNQAKYYSKGIRHITELQALTGGFLPGGKRTKYGPHGIIDQ